MGGSSVLLATFDAGEMKAAFLNTRLTESIIRSRLHLALDVVP